jgi:hypothetical protein
MCGQNVEFVNIKLVVHIVVTGLQSVKWMGSVSIQVGKLLLVNCGARKHTYFLNLTVW